MSDAEGAAKDVVGPMVPGVAATLDADAQRVANWVVAKGLVASQTSNDEQPIPDDHFRRVCAMQGAPANTAVVWIGQRQDLAHPARPGRPRLFDSHFMPVTDVARPGPVPAGLTRYISEGGFLNGTIVQVGYFLALVLQHDWPGLRVRPRPGTRRRADLRPGLATVGGDVRWPSSLPVDGLGDPHQVTGFFEMAPPLVRVYGRSSPSSRSASSSRTRRSRPGQADRRVFARWR